MKTKLFLKGGFCSAQFGCFPGSAWWKYRSYFFTCPETNFVISNILTCFLPLNTALRFSSALIKVLFLGSLF